MINIQRVLILVRMYINSKIELISLPIMLCLAGILIFTTLVGDDREAITFLGLNMKSFSYGYSGNFENKNIALISYIDDWFSTAWLIIAFFYLFPRLLAPLGNSFSISQLLWLRFTRCLPHEISTARALWVIIFATWLGFLGICWALPIALFHHISPKQLLLDIGGLVSHVLLSGGIITVLNFNLKISDEQRRLISATALITPLFLLLIYSILGQNSLLGDYAKFLPYTFPFTREFQDRGLHFGISAVVGIFLLAFHILISFGKTVEGNENSEETVRELECKA